MSRRLGQLELPHDRYRVDIELHDKSLAFSAEVPRLALGGIVVVGFLLTKAPVPRLQLLFCDRSFKLLVSVALVSFAFADGFALGQRFYAGGAAFHHIQVLKLLRLEESTASSESNVNCYLQPEFEQRSALFLRSHRCLTLAALSLIIGTSALGEGFVRFLFP